MQQIYSKFFLIIAVFVCLNGNIIAASSTSRNQSGRVSKNIKTYLLRLQRFGFSGTALVAKNGRILVKSAYGLSNREQNVKMRPDSIFDIGSVTKQFTAAAILVLESDGKLRVEDPISKYLLNVPTDKKGITIHHLLTHTSGLDSEFGSDYEKVSREEVVRRALSSTLKSLPGDRHAYSNVGYSLLAAIVEIVSGQHFDIFLRERLFIPAGMTSTGYFLPDTLSARLATGYKDGEKWGIGMQKAAQTEGDFWNLIGNGGVHSTVGDMYKWITALEQGKILNGEERQKYFKPHVLVSANYQKPNSPLYYAYGWYVWKQPSGKILIFHLGGNGVFNFAVRYHVDDHEVVVYASNVSEFHDPDYPVPVIERIIAGEKVDMPPKVVAVDTQKLALYSGAYRDGSGNKLEILPKGPFLIVQGEGQSALSLVGARKWQFDERLAAFNERTAQIVENSRTGKFEEVFKEFGLADTLADVTDSEKLFWKKRYDRHGEYKATRVLGTLPSARRAYVGRTIVAIDFANGTTYREYLWTPESKIGDLGPIVSAPFSRYFPVSNDCLARFEPADAIISSTICFQRKEAKTLAIVRDSQNDQATLSRF
jgi:CubicO group peptidase (beta-lactamase class C family)